MFPSKRDIKIKRMLILCIGHDDSDESDGDDAGVENNGFYRDENENKSGKN